MAYKFPGVYATINDQSGIVADYTTNSVGYVGESEYGPVFKPTLCTSLQDNINKFGKLNSKYGYAQYSLAVAAETIDQHYFVRVVPTGEAGAHTANDAMWGAANIMKEDAEGSALTNSAYYYDEITAAEKARDAGMDSGLFEVDGVKDENTAFKIVAIDPNNRQFYVTIADSTINENRAYSLIPNSTTLEVNGSTESGSTDANTTVTIRIAANKDILDAFKNTVVDDKIVVSRMKNDALNGVFKITSIIPAEDKITISYRVNGAQASAGDNNARAGLYPAPDETTFSVSVAEKIGRVITTLETFEYCTLYNAQDQYGNSTYVEDVINGSSNYIQVFVNKNYSDEIIVPENISSIELIGGKSGTWADVNAKYTALCNAWELFRDRSQVTVNLLLNSGYVLKGNVSYQAKMLEIAESRRDCFCLFDIPMTETSYEDAIDWRRNVNGMNTYRAALSSPWVKTYDSVQGRANFVMCPSAYIAKIIGASDPWKAPAGLNRGVIGASTVSPTGLTQYYNETEGGNLYTDNQINCIIKNSGAGYVNWGQRTLQQKPSALDRINVARTVIYIETVLREAAKYHVFELNNAYEREQITLQFSSFLDQILSSDGIQSYRVICNTSNNTPQVIANNQLKIDIYLIPSYCAEFILLQTTVENGISTTTVSTGS